MEKLFSLSGSLLHSQLLSGGGLTVVMRHTAAVVAVCVCVDKSKRLYLHVCIAAHVNTFDCMFFFIHGVCVCVCV